MRKIKKYVLSSFILFLLGSLSPALADEMAPAVVKIFVTGNPVDFYRPWQSRGITQSHGSGVILPNNKILTNAHVIAHHTFVQVKKYNDPKKYTAKVIAEGNDCDLALLEVENPDFYKDIPKVELGELSYLQDTVSVLGYPRGGDKLSITEGVVSRIEITNYALSSRQLLTVQIDAAINPGNSGGPVFKDNQLVGIAMQKLVEGQSIGYMIPPPIIQHFFDDLEDDVYQGFPFLGIEFENTENKHLREYYQIQDRKGGIIVESVLPFSPAYNYLEKGDVILKIDDIQIDEDATYLFRKNERLIMTHLISQHQTNDEVKITLIRDGEEKEISLTLHPMNFLVVPPMHYTKPPYFIYGGLAFTVLSDDLLKSWGGRWWEKVPIEMSYYYLGNGRKNPEKRENLVVLLSILSDDLNVGYENHTNQIIKAVNDIEVKSFDHFVKLLNEMKKTQPFTVIKTDSDAIIILDNADIDRINQDILERNNIPFPFSKDVKELLQSLNE